MIFGVILPYPQADSVHYLSACAPTLCSRLYIIGCRLYYWLKYTAPNFSFRLNSCQSFIISFRITYSGV